MYSPDYIIIKNFGSIEYMEYHFKPSISQIIQGKNLDDEGQKSNGVGKSSFIDAIAFCYTGTSVRKLNTDELIRDGERTAYLEHSLKSKDGQDHVVIKRTLDRKEAQVVEIWKNNQPIHKLDSDVNGRNQTILDEIGINKDDLFSFFIVTKERYKSYFRMSDNEKKDIVGRFSNSYKVDKVFKLIEADIVISETKINNLKLNASNLETKLLTYQEEKNNLDLNKEENKTKLETALNDKIIEAQESISLALQEIKALQDKILLQEENIAIERLKIVSKEDLTAKSRLIDELDNTYQNLAENHTFEKQVIEKEILLVEGKQKAIRTEIRDLNQNINELNILKSQFEAQLQTSIECPECHIEFILNSDISIGELQNNVTETESILLEINQELEAQNLKLSEFNLTINKLNSDITQKKTQFTTATEVNRKQRSLLKNTLLLAEQANNTIETKIKNIQVDITRVNNSIQLINVDIELLESKIVAYNEEILNLDKIDNSEAILRYEILIVTNQQELKLKEAELTLEQQELQRLNSWTLKFKSFKSYLANQSVKNIEELTNFYLQKIKTNLTVEISAQQKKKKEIKEKFTEIINRNGFPVGSYGRFSGGEKGRIDFGLILCKQTLINNNAAPKGLDFLLIDEILESLDNMGIENIIKSMNDVDKILFLVTQNEINTLPHQTLTFVKNNGKTEIEH